MKNVLIVASHFPPNSTGGVMRVAKLIKYSTRFDWRTVVVTSTSTTESTELNQDITSALAVYRFPVFDIRKFFKLFKSFVGSIRRLIRRFKRNELSGNSQDFSDEVIHKPVGSTTPSLAHRFCVPDYMFLWTPLAIIGAIYAIKKHNIEVVFSTSPLPSSNNICYWVKKFTRVKWILDMRDPWTTNPMSAKRGHHLLDKYDKFLECRALENADEIVVVTEPFIPPIMKSFPSLQRDKFHVIPNGFDPEDFEQIEPKKFGLFTIVHCGSFYEGRSAEPFLKALSLLKDEDQFLSKKLQVKFVGNAGIAAIEETEKLELSDIVSFVGMVSHQESLEYMAGSDLLLLIPGPGKSTMTGKVFEYLAVENPVLCLADEGALRELLTSTSTGVVVKPEAIESIAETISDFAFKAGDNSFENRDYNKIKHQFNRIEIARRLAKLMDDLSSSSYPK